jgi:hypothetical protein
MYGPLLERAMNGREARISPAPDGRFPQDPSSMRPVRPVVVQLESAISLYIVEKLKELIVGFAGPEAQECVLYPPCSHAPSTL